MMTLYDAVKRELTRMLLRGLESAPAANELPQVSSVYVDDLRAANLTDADADRVLRAFVALGPRVHRWPTPADVLEALPRRERPALPEREMTLEEIQTNRKRLADMMRKCLGFSSRNIK
jgi:hypothetical protein